MRQEPVGDSPWTAAAGASQQCDGGQQLDQEGAHVHPALTLVIAANNLFGRVQVRIGGQVLHQETRGDEACDQAGDNRPVVAQVIIEQRGPHPVQYDHGDGGNDHTGDRPDQGRNHEPLVEVL
jgi:hypothetical protein